MVYNYNMRARDVIRALEADGWQLRRQNGSHRQYKHPTKPGLVTVSAHRLSDDIPIGTLRSIEIQAGITFEGR